jgi:hypothetical protein
MHSIYAEDTEKQLILKLMFLVYVLLRRFIIYWSYEASCNYYPDSTILYIWYICYVSYEQKNFFWLWLSILLF